MSSTIQFKEDDIVYLIENHQILADKRYIIRKIEVENGDKLNDTYEVTYFADLEDIDTKEIQKKIIAYKNYLYNWNYLYIIKI
jgi:hypothetical protein